VYDHRRRGSTTDEEKDDQQGKKDFQEIAKPKRRLLFLAVELLTFESMGTFFSATCRESSLSIIRLLEKTTSICMLQFSSWLKLRQKLCKKRFIINLIKIIS